MARAARFVPQAGQRSSQKHRFLCKCLLWVALPLIVGSTSNIQESNSTNTTAQELDATNTTAQEPDVTNTTVQGSGATNTTVQESDATNTTAEDNATNTTPKESDVTNTTNVVFDVTFMVSELEAQMANLAQQLEVERQRVSELSTRVDEGESTTDGLKNSIDTGWLVYNTALVFLMQLGFALVEAGSVRKKSYRHVFLKNMMDCSVGMALWLLIGYWIAFPGTWEGNFIELEKWEIFFIAEEGRFFAFQTVFASTAITIISGAMAERTRMEAYLAFCGICGALVYAVVVRWTWGGGWLAEKDIPYHDFAGSGVVHATGGAAAFVGATLVGPRAGRFEDGTTLADDDHFRPHSLDNIVMGTFLLWFGWFGFNPGSTTSLIDDNADIAAIAFVNTMVCPVFAAITVMIFGVTRHSCYRGPEENKPPLFDLGKICNGVLGGLVGITAGCDSIPVEWTIVVGIISGLGVSGWTLLCVRIKVDDPVDASAVHGCCGVIGVLAVGFFHKDVGLVAPEGNADLLRTNAIGIASIVGYVCGTAFVYFYVVYAFGYLRLDMVVEIMGIDRMDFALIESEEITALEIQAATRYRQKLLDRFQGHLWGISEEQGVIYAQIHRAVTVFFLVIAMVYNYFFYTHFEWRGWNFFSVVNLAVGCQCAAASHAEFICRPGDIQVRLCCFAVVIIGIGLAICNFLIAPHGDLLMAWIRTMTLSFSWALWMHLRVHPVDWEAVCRTKSRVDRHMAEYSSETSNDSNSGRRRSSLSRTLSKANEWHTVTMMKATFEVGASSSCIGYLWEMFIAGRFQHVGESTMAYASVTSDLWVGLDELREYMDDDTGKGDLGLGLALIFFSGLQCIGVMSRLLVPTKLRSVRFFQLVLLITTLSEAPILVLVFVNSKSSLKWVSVFFSSASIIFQLFNLIIAVWMRKKTKAKENVRPRLLDIPFPKVQFRNLDKKEDSVQFVSSRKVDTVTSSIKETKIVEEKDEVTMELLEHPKGPSPRYSSDTSFDSGVRPASARTLVAKTPRSQPASARGDEVVTPMPSSRLFDPKTPRMTTPRPLSALDEFMVRPELGSHKHQPFGTPRGYTPRNQ